MSCLFLDRVICTLRLHTITNNLQLAMQCRPVTKFGKVRSNQRWQQMSSHLVETRCTGISQYGSFVFTADVASLFCFQRLQRHVGTSSFLLLCTVSIGRCMNRGFTQSVEWSGGEYTLACTSFISNLIVAPINFQVHRRSRKEEREVLI